MIFQVSIGRSASLNDQSNFCSAIGSSVGSWYGDRYSCASASPAFTRARGSKTSIFSSRSTATSVSNRSNELIMLESNQVLNDDIPAGSAFLNLFARGCRSRFGNDWTKRRVCMLQLASFFTSRSDRNPYVFTANCLDDLIRRRPEKLCDDRKLIDVVFAREQRFTLKHLRKDTARAPDVDLHVVLLPREHDFRSAVVSCRDIAGHLRVLYSC